MTTRLSEVWAWRNSPDSDAVGSPEDGLTVLCDKYGPSKPVIRCFLLNLLAQCNDQLVVAEMRQSKFGWPLNLRHGQLQDAVWFRRFDLQREPRKAVGVSLLQESCHFGRGFLFDLREFEAACTIAKGGVLKPASRRATRSCSGEIRGRHPS